MCGVHGGRDHKGRLRTLHVWRFPLTGAPLLPLYRAVEKRILPPWGIARVVKRMLRDFVGDGTRLGSPYCGGDGIESRYFPVLKLRNNCEIGKWICNKLYVGSNSG
jgi:hypothetical protein